MVVMLKLVENIAMGLKSLLLYTHRSYTTYMSLSLSLNFLLTLMIVARLVLQSWNIRAGMGPSAGISGLYKSIATMLIESSALFAVSSLLVVVPMGLDHPIAELFVPILAETQVRVFPSPIYRRVVPYDNGMSRSSLRCSSFNESPTRAH